MSDRWRLAVGKCVQGGILLVLMIAACGDGQDGGSRQDATAPAADASSAVDSAISSRSDAAEGVSRPDAPMAGQKVSLSALDVLFVVGTGPEMAGAQRRLAMAAPAFFAELEAITTKLPDLHVGVVSSDFGSGGRPVPGDEICSRPAGDGAQLARASACSVTGAFLNLPAGGSPNFSGGVAEKLACLVQLGTTGCAFPQPLAVAGLALNENAIPANRGFARKDVDTLIVLVGDDDDCTVVPGDPLYSDSQYTGQSRRLRCALTGHICDVMPVPAMPFQSPFAACRANPGGSDRLKRVRDIADQVRASKIGGRIFVAAIAGWPSDPAAATYRISSMDIAGTNALVLNPVCGSGPTAARPALRLKAFVDLFGARGDVVSLCSEDLGPALRRAARLLLAP
jgi:hypothetical protein